VPTMLLRNLRSGSVVRVTGPAWRNLLRKLEEQGADIGPLQRALPEVFWKIRHKVIHEGYSPKDDELRIIEDSVRNLLGAVRNYLLIKP